MQLRRKRMAEKKYHLKERLRHARELRGWGQQELAERLGVPEERTIRRWERGESQPTPYYRQRLCEVFGLNAEELGLLESAAAPPFQGRPLPGATPHRWTT
jgi:transcriptional regulator with XRE-family HTH domain